MKSSGKYLAKIKHGATSIYIVVFATILFGVVTLSFVRIMLSEASQSSDDDLSQSAYDSAMAGVEDAKIAVNEYYSCLSSGGGASACDWKNVITKNPDNPTCDNSFLLGEVLHNRSSGDREEIPIVSTSTSSNNSTDVSDQAYTCVIISDVTPDYRGTLTSDTRTKVIPISVTRDGGDGSMGASSSSDLSSVSYIDFSWYSELNRGSLQSSGYRLASDGKFRNLNNTTIPPTIQLTLLRVRQGQLNFSDLHSDNTSSDGTINSTMVLLPSSGSNPNLISSAAILSYGYISSTDTPVPVTCGDGEFACTVRLDVSGLNFEYGDNVFLVASLPYGDAMSDFAVTLLKDDGVTPVKFRGVQISVDSTGRTNQLFRRVEVRLDPADLFFPYPQYAVELGGGDGQSLLKNFWVTANCWYNQPVSNGGYCDNNGNV